MAVSPFDGVNRIRFKGSPGEFRISECEFRIYQHLLAFNPQSEIRNPQFLPDSQPRSLVDRGSPETRFDFQTVEGILGRLGRRCKQADSAAHYPNLPSLTAPPQPRCSVGDPGVGLLTLTSLVALVVYRYPTVREACENKSLGGATITPPAIIPLLYHTRTFPGTD
jgi:hypothetical protein